VPDTNAAARAVRRPGKPGGRKTANRFAKFAGGDAAAAADTDHSPAGSVPAADSGLIGGMTVIAAEEAHRVVQIPVGEIAAHPFNDPYRSQPQPGDPKWEELLNGVKANGVRLPVLVVPRDAFVAARSSTAGQIPTDARYVLVYGHRRRVAALEAGRPTIPAVIDDAIMADDGDLDAMATENLGRQDLSELAEANLFARYSEIGVSQRAMAERLGIDQATVSRRLALLLLTPELRRAVEEGRLRSTDAAAVAGALPYGPARRWQKTKDPDQLSDRRATEQAQVLQFIVDKRLTASAAAERVRAERDARARADQLGIDVVPDPRAELGDRCHQYRVAEYTPGIDIVGAINSGTGALELYARPAPEDDATPEASAALDDPQDADLDLAADHRAADQAAAGRATRTAAAAIVDAQVLRRESCKVLITHQPSNSDLLKVLVGQYVSGVAARSAAPAADALLREWGADTGGGGGEKARAARAWQRAVAAAELHTSELKDRGWDASAAAHLALLVERVGYQPTTWEHDKLETGDQ
jgi:ParB family chromosome partitioning protein